MGEMGSSAASTVTKTRASFHGLVLWQRIILTEQKGEKRSKKKLMIGEAKLTSQDHSSM